MTESVEACSKRMVASFNAASGRSTPSYINGTLYTVAGPQRHVVAIDPGSGETIQQVFAVALGLAEKGHSLLDGVAQTIAED